MLYIEIMASLKSPIGFSDLALSPGHPTTQLRLQTDFFEANFILLISLVMDKLR